VATLPSAEVRRLRGPLLNPQSQYTIAELIGKPQTTVNYMVKRMRTILQQHVGREDLGI